MEIATPQELTVDLIDWSPVGMGRPRATAIGGHARVYTPAASARALATVQALARVEAARIGWTPIPRPQTCSVQIEAWFRLPTSTPQKRRLALLGQWCAKRPDLDNIAKLILDALGGVAWEDDSQVAQLQASKYWSNLDGARVIVRRVAL